MSLSEAFIRATRRIRELEVKANTNATQSIRRIEMKDSITPSRIAWLVYWDTKDDKLYGLENCSEKDIEEAKAKLAVRQSDFKYYSDIFQINFPSHSPERDSTLLKPISSISVPTLHWFEKAQPVSLLAQCNQPIVSEGLHTPHMLSKNVRWSVRTLLFVPGSIECLENEIITLIMSRNGLPIPLEDLPDLYYWTYGRLFLAIDGYKSQDDETHDTPLCSLNEALGSKMNRIQLHNSPHRTILLKDPAIVNPDRIYISCPTDAKYEDIREHFRKLDENSKVLHFQQLGYGYVTCSSPAYVDDILSRTNPHKVGDFEVRVHHYLKQPYPSASRVPGLSYQHLYTYPYAYGALAVAHAELQGLPSTNFHYVMGCEEASYIQFLEDEDYRRSPNPPTRDDHRYSVPDLPDLPEDLYIDYSDYCTNPQ